MDLAHRALTLAGANQRIANFVFIEADAADLYVSLMSITLTTVLIKLNVLSSSVHLGMFGLTYHRTFLSVWGTTGTSTTSSRGLLVVRR